MPGRDTVHFKERGCLSTQVLRGQLGQASLWSKRGKESSWNIPMTGHGQEHLWGKQEHRRHQERKPFFETGTSGFRRVRGQGQEHLDVLVIESYFQEVCRETLWSALIETQFKKKTS